MLMQTQTSIIIFGQLSGRTPVCGQITSDINKPRITQSGDWTAVEWRLETIVTLRLGLRGEVTGY